MNSEISIISKAEYPELMQVWEASVRATHHFLKEEDIVFFRKVIPEKYLDAVHLYAVRDSHNKILGFLGVSDDNIEMLFIHPDARGKGVGSLLLSYALNELHLRKVDVNEQNEQAVGFYLHKGFVGWASNSERILLFSKFKNKEGAFSFLQISSN